MITEQQVERALDYIRDNSDDFGAAKSVRAHLEQFRKSKKAMLMQKIDGPEHVRAAYAYSHPEYLTLLNDLKAAVAEEESLKWKLKAAELKVEAWRTQQANNRRIDNSHR